MGIKVFFEVPPQMKVLHLSLSSTIIVCKTNESICIFSSVIEDHAWVAIFFWIFFHTIFNPKSMAMWNSLKKFENYYKILVIFKANVALDPAPPTNNIRNTPNANISHLHGL
jgi:hypothetical protein